MKLKISILRQHSPQEQPYRQLITYEAAPEDTVATLLKKLNAERTLTDENGKTVGKIHWQCSCLQKKCGACAMVINGRPRLACDVRLGEFKNGKLSLDPLKKFPTVRDLIVDRSVMFQNLSVLGVWLEEQAQLDNRKTELAYESSRCLQCGCCLEVCPNFIPGEGFFSAAAVAPVTRILAGLPKRQKYEILKSYQKHIYSGCGKSLSCMNICPAGIEIQQLLVNSNAAAVWKR